MNRTSFLMDMSRLLKCSEVTKLQERQQESQGKQDHANGGGFTHIRIDPALLIQVVDQRRCGIERSALCHDLDLPEDAQRGNDRHWYDKDVHQVQAGHRNKAELLERTRAIDASGFI